MLLTRLMLLNKVNQSPLQLLSSTMLNILSPISFSTSCPMILFITFESNQCCPYAHVHGILFRDASKPAVPQEKKECPSISTDQVTFISPTRTGVWAVPSYSLLESLTGLILCRSCVGNLRCYEIMFETALSCLENSIYRILLHPLHLTFSQKFPESWSKQDI